MEVKYGNLSLSTGVDILASYLADAPAGMLKIMNKVGGLLGEGGGDKGGRGLVGTVV